MPKVQDDARTRAIALRDVPVRFPKKLRLPDRQEVSVYKRSITGALVAVW